MMISSPSSELVQSGVMVGELPKRKAPSGVFVSQKKGALTSSACEEAPKVQNVSTCPISDLKSRDKSQGVKEGEIRALSDSTGDRGEEKDKENRDDGTKVTTMSTILNPSQDGVVESQFPFAFGTFASNQKCEDKAVFSSQGDISAYAILDGHGSTFACDIVAEVLLDSVIASVQKVRARHQDADRSSDRAQDPGALSAEEPAARNSPAEKSSSPPLAESSSSSASTYQMDVARALTDCFAACDEEIFSRALQGFTDSGCREKKFCRAGCCVVLFLLVGQDMFVAHVGDCRAVLWSQPASTTSNDSLQPTGMTRTLGGLPLEESVALELSRGFSPDSSAISSPASQRPSQLASRSATPSPGTAPLSSVHVAALTQLSQKQNSQGEGEGEAEEDGLVGSDGGVARAGAVGTTSRTGMSQMSPSGASTTSTGSAATSITAATNNSNPGGASTCTSAPSSSSISRKHSTRTPTAENATSAGPRSSPHKTYRYQSPSQPQQLTTVEVGTLRVGDQPLLLSTPSSTGARTPSTLSSTASANASTNVSEHTTGRRPPRACTLPTAPPPFRAGTPHGSFVALTEDHSCADERECARVKALTADPSPIRQSERDRRMYGSSRAPYRVAGTLAITRSLGDFYLKRPQLSSKPHKDRLPYVHCGPTVSFRPLSSGDSLVLMASDGLWNFLQADELAELLDNAFMPEQGTAAAILEHGSLRAARTAALTSLTQGILDRCIVSAALTSRLLPTDVRSRPKGTALRTVIDDVTLVLLLLPPAR